MLVFDVHKKVRSPLCEKATVSSPTKNSMGERNGAFSALCLPLVGEVASENLAIFAANVLGIFIVQLLKKCPR